MTGILDCPFAVCIVKVHTNFEELRILSDACSQKPEDTEYDKKLLISYKNELTDIPKKIQNETALFQKFAWELDLIKEH